MKFGPRKTEGAGNAGRAMRPQPRMQNKIAYELVTTVTPETPSIPRAMVYGLYRALLGDRALLPPSPALLLADLTPASGCQDHTASHVRINTVRYRRIRVHRITSRDRDDRVSLLSGTGRW